jgi:FkbM family methyltransferase
MILRRIFEYQGSGFYVDVGAHHPYRFSNTYLFYLRGWRGINIDALPGGMKLFEKARPRDINLELAIAEEPGELTYYMFEEPALNGFSHELSRQRAADASGSKLIGTATIEVKPLSTVLAQHLPENQPIDFMTVDVEGLDLQVLSSNDWGRFRPKVVLAESLGESMNSVANGPIATLLAEAGYALVAKTVNTGIYRDSRL